MRHKAGASREQVSLLPATLDDYVSDNNPVRFIEAFVEQLDLIELHFKKATVMPVGRKPYNPKDLLKLYIWGYLNRVNSSRKLEREAGRNMEVMWLLGSLKPDDKTISEFRRENAAALKGVFVEFRVLCQNLKLFSDTQVAIDGSKFKASNSRKRIYTRKQLQKRIKEIEEHVEKYLEGLQASDLEESKLPREDAATLKKKIESLEKTSRDYRKLLGELDKAGESQVALTDADCRLMDNGGKAGVCYNAQVAADSRHNLIVDFEVTNAANDQKQLSPMAKAAKDALGVEKLEVLADSGYCTPEQIDECDKNNITTYLPVVDYSKPNTCSKKEVPAEAYWKNKFTYNPERDTYTCPQGQELVRIGRKERDYGTKACKSCEVRGECTSSNRGRTVHRNQHEEALEALQQRVKASPEKNKKRGQIVEPIFGVAKHAFGFRSFSLRGLAGVNAEFSLVALAYNLRRVLNIVPLSELMARVQISTA